MKRTALDLVPALVLALGIIVSTAIAALVPESGLLVLAGPLLLALTLVGADVLGSRLSGKPPRPSWSTLVLAAALLAACAIVALSDPAQVAMIIPILGGSVAVGILSLSQARRQACRWL